MEWHLARCGQLHAILETAGVEDFVVDTTALSAVQTAAALIDGAGWAATP